MTEFTDICDRLNQLAPSLAAELLPNGHRAGNKWVASGIADNGQGTSLVVDLTGLKIGHWNDFGNAAAGEDRGDMLDLLALKNFGGDSKAALADAKRRLGIEDDWKPGKGISAEEKARRAEEARKRAAELEAAEEERREKKARNARRLYLRGERIEGTPAEHYMRGRGLAPVPGHEWPGSLRYFDKVRHGPLKQDLPAMLAGIVTAEGRQIGTHRIFIERNGRGGWTKIKTDPGVPAKMVLGSMGGGFVPIHKGSSGLTMRRAPEGEPVYITEGIEDAQAVAMMKPDARVIAAISLANIGAIILPPAIGKLVVVGDRDENPNAQDQLERSIARQQARGLEVSLVLPPMGIKDINDWLLADGGGA